MQGDEGAVGFGEGGGGIAEGAEFAFGGFGGAGVGADLDELLAAISVAGQEVDLVASGSSDPGGGGAAALEFEQDECFKRVADVGTSGLIVEGDERGVDRVGFARIDHALALRVWLFEWQSFVFIWETNPHPFISLTERIFQNLALPSSGWIWRVA